MVPKSWKIATTGTATSGPIEPDQHRKYQHAAAEASSARQRQPNSCGDEYDRQLPDNQVFQNIFPRY